jgi:RNA polymerase sigma-70 factor (ECF subfamily)
MGQADNIISLSGAKAPEKKPLSEHSDDELVLLARGGLKEAFDTLVRRHQHRVLCVAVKMLGQPQAARDAAQSTFLEVYRYLPRYRPRGKFRAFLNRVLINQCRMALRSRRTEREAQARLQQSAQWNRSDLAEDVLLARERRREVERALEQLSKKLRTVLVLRFAAELSYTEISDTLSIPVGTVKSRIFAGMEKLRQIMEGAGP